MLKDKDFEEFRTLLTTLRARIRGDFQHLTRGALGKENGGSDMRNPNHLAEMGTEVYEQDFSLRVAENDQEVLSEIDAALERLNAGDFGLCEGCLDEGKARSKAYIPKARLRAIPHARTCVQCARKREELGY